MQNPLSTLHMALLSKMLTAAHLELSHGVHYWQPPYLHSNHVLKKPEFTHQTRTTTLVQLQRLALAHLQAAIYQIFIITSVVLPTRSLVIIGAHREYSARPLLLRHAHHAAGALLQHLPGPVDDVAQQRRVLGLLGDLEAHIEGDLVVKLPYYVRLYIYMYVCVYIYIYTFMSDHFTLY